MAGRAIAQFKKKRDGEVANKNAEEAKTDVGTNSEASMSLEDRIRVRAHELYIQRGGENGSELDDWLRAETEILGT